MWLSALSLTAKANLSVPLDSQQAKFLDKYGEKKTCGQIFLIEYQCIKHQAIT